MKLRFYRFMESVFSLPTAYFGDMADSIDNKLHERLRVRMEDIKHRLTASQQAASRGAAKRRGPVS